MPICFYFGILDLKLEFLFKLYGNKFPGSQEIVSIHLLSVLKVKIKLNGCRMPSKKISGQIIKILRSEILREVFFYEKFHPVIWL